MFALVPDSILSILWAIGCPTSMLAPGIALSRSLTSAKNSSRLLSDSSNGTSSSEVFSPKKCSASSARPVLHATEVTSGIPRSIFCASIPIFSDSSSDTPGGNEILTVSAPSLKAGRNELPVVVNRITEIKKINAVNPITILLLPSVKSSDLR